MNSGGIRERERTRGKRERDGKTKEEEEEVEERAVVFPSSFLLPICLKKKEILVVFFDSPMTTSTRLIASFVAAEPVATAIV